MAGNYSDDATEKYFGLLSRGGLTVPSSQMIEFVLFFSFFILDYADKFIEIHNL